LAGKCCGIIDYYFGFWVGDLTDFGGRGSKGKSSAKRCNQVAVRVN